MSELTLTLIQVGFLALLWLMVLSVATVMRSDLFARRRARSTRSDARAGKAQARAQQKAVKAQEKAQEKAQAKAQRRAPGATAPSGQAKSRAKSGGPRLLLVTAGAQQGVTVELGAGPITVGRAPENTLPLEDDYVSSRHARLYPYEGAWVVEDLGSTNGTFLDKTRVMTPTVVPLGAQVRLGKTVLELRK